MADLDMLAGILRSGAKGKADLAGLDEQFTRANAMRDSKGPQINQYGTVSPMAVMANVINQSRGRKQARELTPQRAAARQSVAESANAFPLHQARQQQENFDTTELNKVAAAKGLAQAKMAAVQAKNLREDTKGTTITKVDPNGQERTVIYHPQTNAATVDGQAISDFSNWTDPVKKSKVANVGGAGYGNKDIDKSGRAALTAMSKTHRMASIGNKLNETDRAQLNDSSNLFKQVMVSTFTPSKLQALVKDNLSGYSQASKDFIVGVARMSAEERHELFGAALTPTEKESSEDFMARVEGLSFDQMMARMSDSYGARMEELKVLDALGGGEQFTGAVGRMGWDAFNPKAPPEAAGGGDLAAKIAALEAEIAADEAK
jgi:hypothetical protein